MATVNPEACGVGDQVVCSDGAELGTVVAIGPSYLVVGAGRVLPNDYYIPTLAIHDCAGNRITLNVSREEAFQMGWDQPPRDPAVVP